MIIVITLTNDMHLAPMLAKTAEQVGFIYYEGCEVSLFPMRHQLWT